MNTVESPARKAGKYKLDCQIFPFINLPTKNREVTLAKDTDFSSSFGA